jgi:hypothetical protein
MKGPFQTQYYPSYVKYGWKQWYRTDNGQKVRRPLPYNHGYSVLVAQSPNWPYSGQNLTLYDASYGYTRNARFNYYTGSADPMPLIRNQAYDRFINSLKTKVNMGLNVAEGRQTLDLLSRAARAIRKPLDTFARRAQKHLSRGGAERTLGSMPNAWLAWQFGVAPLVRDMQELLKLLHEQRNAKPFAVSEQKTVYLPTQKVGSTPYAMEAFEAYRLTCRWTAWVRRKTMDQITPSDLGLIDFSLPWELVPYSFVFDYFTNIGKYLESLTDFIDYEVTDCYRTETSRGDLLLRCTNQWPQVLARGASRTFESFRIVRTLHPQPYVAPFTIRNGISSTRAINLFAILAQIVARK